jgi:hypothetical protein
MTDVEYTEQALDFVFRLGGGWETREPGTLGPRP